MSVFKYNGALLAAMAALVIALAAGCGLDTEGGVEFVEPAAAFEDAIDPGVAEEVSVLGSEIVSPEVAEVAQLETADPELSGTGEIKISPRLGFVDGKQAVAMENGGRVPLGEGRIAEVFLSPYPPDWQTDLHLFLLDNVTFEPIEDLDVQLDYEMVYMDHGTSSSLGSKLAEGHYLVPLDFLMYGDWNVEVRLDLPEGRKRLEFVVKFFPCPGCSE